mmetsp:Transcript_32798/g.83820  ORF Transcript_32798/g.83820 Transcript_32798/m.83820 type:complete len:267 (+) Transcript_32798:337-1137(+)
MLAHLDELLEGTCLSANAAKTQWLICTEPPADNPPILPIEVCTSIMVAGVPIGAPEDLQPLLEEGHPRSPAPAHPRHGLLRRTTGRPPPPPALHLALPAGDASSRHGRIAPIHAASRSKYDGHLTNGIACGSWRTAPSSRWLTRSAPYIPMAPPPPDTQHRWSEALYALVSVDTVLDGLKAKIPPPAGLHRLPRPRLLSQLYTAVKVRQYCDLVKQRSRRASLQHRARGQVPRPTPPTLRCLRTQLPWPRDAPPASSQWRSRPEVA